MWRFTKRNAPSYRFTHQRCDGKISNELKTTGVRSSSYKFVVDVIVDVIVDFTLVRASYMKDFGI
ncbi:MAG: hypothetical protein GWP12_01035 [Nitrospirae bacterium]|nr:hypothetical protein [Nitrospirota bacterium]